MQNNRLLQKKEIKTLVVAVLFKIFLYLHLFPACHIFFGRLGPIPSSCSSLFCQHKKDPERRGTQATFFSLLCTCGNILLYLTNKLKTCNRCKSINARSIVLILFLFPTEIHKCPLELLRHALIQGWDNLSAFICLSLEDD